MKEVIDDAPYPRNKPHHRALRIDDPQPFQELPYRSVTVHDPRGRLECALMVSAGDDDFDKGLWGLYVEGFHDGRYVYVVDGEVVPRPPNPTLLTGTTLYNVPLPSLIKIADMVGFSFGMEFSPTDSTVELDFQVPGTYAVRVISFPELDVDFVIKVP